jgi:hypothetical protein
MHRLPYQLLIARHGADDHPTRAWISALASYSMSSSDDLDAHDAEPYEPTEEEIARLLSASKEEYEAVDAMILRECTSRFQKVAKIVGDLLKEFDRVYGNLPFAHASVDGASGRAGQGGDRR